MEISTGQSAVIIAVLVHAAATIWWASKTNTLIQVIVEDLNQIRRDLEKRDAQAEAIWKKIDKIQDDVRELKNVN